MTMTIKRYHYWQIKHCWSILRLRRGVVVATTLAIVSLHTGRMMLAPRTYKATAVISVPGLCPHGIIIGEPYVGIMGLGNTNLFITEVACGQCPQTAKP